MNLGTSPFRLIFLALAALACAAAPAWRWQARLEKNDGELRDTLRDQPALTPDPAADSYQKFHESAGDYSAEYGFKNFNRDYIKVAFKVKKDFYSAYDSAWGYSSKDVEALKSWQTKARQEALGKAEQSGQTQEQLNSTLADIKRQYKQKLKDYLSSRGMLLRPDNTVDVDMPALVRKNTPLVRPLVEDIDLFARKNHYGSEEIIGAAAAMVQTAILYKVPPAVEGDIHTGGLWPPVKTLVVGWGDCDTKSGTLASILRNYPDARVVGVSVPDHYLLGVLRIPNKGDAYIEYQGAHYVLIEAAGPAWLPPGMVSANTLTLLSSREGAEIEPFF